MTITVTITGQNVFDPWGRRITGSQVLDNAFAHSLIMAGLARANTPGQHPPPVNSPFDSGGMVITLDASATLTNQFTGSTVICTVPLTLTVPGGLSSNFACIVVCPAAGNVTIAVSQNATINGAQTSLTRALAANANGFSIAQASNVPDTFTVSGS